MSFIIPIEQMSLAAQYQMRFGAIQKGKARGAELWKMAEKNLTARDPDYVNDFILPNSPAAVATAGWLSMPLNAIGTFYSVFADSTPAAVAPVVPTNQIWVFYNMSMLTIAGPEPVSQLEFRLGAAANLNATFDVESVYGMTMAAGYFSQPVCYENPDIVTAQIECRVVTAAGCRFHLGMFIIEPLKNTVI